jgi:hypothetical protein
VDRVRDRPERGGRREEQLTAGLALFQLATELPAAVLARLPGIVIKVAVAWQHASVGDWLANAAGISRRQEY